MQTYYNIRPHLEIGSMIPMQMANIPINIRGNRRGDYDRGEHLLHCLM